MEGRRREMGIGGKEEGDGYWREGGERWVLEGRRREMGIGGKEEGDGHWREGGGRRVLEERRREKEKEGGEVEQYFMMKGGEAIYERTGAAFSPPPSRMHFTPNPPVSWRHTSTRFCVVLRSTILTTFKIKSIYVNSRH